MVSASAALLAVQGIIQRQRRETNSLRQSLGAVEKRGSGASFPLETTVIPIVSGIGLIVDTLCSKLSSETSIPTLVSWECPAHQARGHCIPKGLPSLVTKGHFALRDVQTVLGLERRWKERDGTQALSNYPIILLESDEKARSDAPPDVPLAPSES